MSTADATVELIDPFGYTTSDIEFKNQYPIELLVSKNNNYEDNHWVLGKHLGVSSDYENAIFTRDYHVCRFCGFRSEKYMDTLIRNGQEWRLDSVVTACIFCSQCLTMERVQEMRSGVILYLPEVSQIELNQIAKVIYVCRISQGYQAEQVRKLLDALMARRKKAAEIITDDPSTFVEKIQNCSSLEEYNNIKDKSQDLRLFPLDRRIIKEKELEFNQFPQILAYWRSKKGPFAGLPPNTIDVEKINLLIAELEAK